MLRNKLKFPAILIPILLLGGCASTVEVVPLSEGAKKLSTENAVPYYLPMPCLLVTKNMSCNMQKPSSPSDSTTGKNASTSKSGKIATRSAGTNIPARLPAAQTDTGKDQYEFQIVYLPDTDKLYGIKFTHGTGSFQHGITLQDGWKLTTLNAQGDNKASDTISALSGAIPAITRALADTSTRSDGSKSSQKKESVPELWIYRLHMQNNQLELIFHWKPENSQ